MKTTATRPENGCALFYHRDSGAKHEQAPAAYVVWAQQRAKELKLQFDGTPERVNAMIREGRCTNGDLYVDNGTPGNLLSRSGLDALIERASSDDNVSHILIPRRDRLARPNDPLDGVKLETGLRRLGVTLVFTDRTCAPMLKGRRQDKGELIVAMLDYDSAGDYRYNLADAIIRAQIELAKAGFSTGGRPPYYFRRWLAKDDGTPVRQLEDGEVVRMKHHHVIWLPGPDEELRICLRIIDALETMPASRVAAMLTAEGVPAPNAGRFRTDHCAIV